ncbi:MAG: hypothetical protein R2942_03215 [Ignavibacteria bacterium]
MFVGVRVSNQYGQVTKYFGDNHSERIYPKGFIRPPDPPINGCPVAYTLTESGYVPENNTLNKSTFPGNAGIDLTDKIILKNEPARNTSIIHLVLLLMRQQVISMNLMQSDF